MLIHVKAKYSIEIHSYDKFTFQNFFWSKKILCQGTQSNKLTFCDILYPVLKGQKKDTFKAVSLTDVQISLNNRSHLTLSRSIFEFI